MKKILLVLCIGIVVCLSGCGNINKYRSDQELSDEMLENIISSVEEKDVDQFINLFSKEAIDKAVNLENCVEEFMEFYQGNMKRYDGLPSSNRASKYGRTVERNLRVHYTVVTDQEEYAIAFDYCVIDEENPDRVGLTAIEITSKEHYDNEDFRWSYTSRPGVYVAE